LLIKAVQTLSTIILLIVGSSACDKEQILPDTLVADQNGIMKGAASKNKVNHKATGSVELTWKWFSPDALNDPSINNIAGWPHLCKKTSIGGNIVVHAK
jgi:hypothetical protein